MLMASISCFEHFVELDELKLRFRSCLKISLILNRLPFKPSQGTKYPNFEPKGGIAWFMYVNVFVKLVKLSICIEDYLGALKNNERGLFKNFKKH